MTHAFACGATVKVACGVTLCEMNASAVIASCRVRAVWVEPMTAGQAPDVASHQRCRLRNSGGCLMCERDHGGVFLSAWGVPALSSPDYDSPPGVGHTPPAIVPDRATDLR